MENQVETTTQESTTPEDIARKGIEQTLSVIRVVEGLFNAVKLASFPLHTTEQAMAGMNFLAQFHSQLVSQLPPAVVEDLRKAQSPAPVTEVSNEPAKA